MVKTFSFQEKNNGSNPFLAQKEPSENENLILIFLQTRNCKQYVIGVNNITKKHMMVKYVKLLKILDKDFF